MIDTGATLAEGAALHRWLRAGPGRSPTHVAITHGHFDHCFGTAAMPDVEVFGQRGLPGYLEREDLRGDAVRHGVSPVLADAAAASLRSPDHLVDLEYVLDLGGPRVLLLHPGPGHTDHDLAVVVRLPGGMATVAFCGDLVEESGPPQAGPDAKARQWPSALDRLLTVAGTDAQYVPGHGAVVNAGFVRAQRDALARRFGQD